MMSERPLGLFPWVILIIALVVPNPWKLASERAFAEKILKTEQCTMASDQEKKKAESALAARITVKDLNQITPHKGINNPIAILSIQL